MLLMAFICKDLMMGGEKGLGDGWGQKAAALLGLCLGIPRAESQIWSFT